MLIFVSIFVNRIHVCFLEQNSVIFVVPAMRIGVRRHDAELKEKHKM